ncbi:MAG: extracellular solute-binding protein [Oscillospiraceae bacterium]|nr:extracellular solute-binding protein [Oscillospiraceae bacterium]
MRSKRRLFAIVMVMCILSGLSLSSCSNSKPIELRFMGYNEESSRVTYLKYLDENLKGIKVNFEFVSLDNFSSILDTQLKNGTGPDIIEVGGETKLLANSGYLLDLTDQAFVKNYARSGLSAYIANDKIYATPLQSWYEGIFYNKRIFAENGISVPKSLDQFISIHKELSAKGIKPQAMGAQSWEPMMKQSIGIVNNEFYSDTANRNFDNEFNDGKAFLADSWLDAVTAWSDVIKQGCLTPDMLNVTYDQALSEFAMGDAAMWESGPWAVNAIVGINPDIEKDLGMFPIPGLSEGTGWLVGGPGSALAINAKSKHTKQALELLALTATPAAQEALIKDNAGSSFLIGVRADLGDIYSDCAEAFQAGNVYAPWVSVWEYGNVIVEEYGKSLQDVLAGTKTIEQALKDADAICAAMRN